MVVDKGSGRTEAEAEAEDMVPPGWSRRRLSDARLMLSCLVSCRVV